MKNKFWKSYGAYWGFIIGMLGVQLILKGRIEHLPNQIVAIGMGFVINIVLVNLMSLKYKK